MALTWSWQEAMERTLGNPALEPLDMSGDYLALTPCWKSYEITGQFSLGQELYIYPSGCFLWVLKWYTLMSDSLIHQTATYAYNR